MCDDLPNTNNKLVDFELVNVNTFIIYMRFGLININTIIIRIGFGLTNVNIIRILIQYEHEPSS